MKLKLISFASLAAVAVLASANSAHAAVIDLGTTYTPAGADYTITAVQGIDAANPLGQSGLSPHVIQTGDPGDGGGKGAFTGIGVSYQTSAGGALAEAGVNLYNNGPSAGIQSTGLKVQYNSAVTASSITLTLEDFDVKTGTSFGPSGKAEPDITLFGAGGSVLGTATPAQVLASHPSFSTSNDGTFGVNLGSVLTALGQSKDTAISGYLLSAANFSGEKFQGPTTDDPYLLGNAGQGAPAPTPPPSVPEPSTFLPLLGVLGLIIGGPIARRRFTRVAQ